MKSQSIQHGELCRLLSYDRETGEFRWNVTRSFTARKGVRAGSIWYPAKKSEHWIEHPYWQVRVGGYSYLAHRLAWFYVTEQWPTLVDHKNGNGLDNRWSNLRLASHSQNTANSRVVGAVPFKGVCLNKRTGRYQASIRKDGVSHYLGQFDTPEEAGDAYLRASAHLHGDFTFQTEKAL